MEDLLRHEKPGIFKEMRSVPPFCMAFKSFPAGLAARELLAIEHPQLGPDSEEMKRIISDTACFRDMLRDCVWVYYPWRRTAICMLSEKKYFRLRTARNRHLITEEEQAAYRNIPVGIAGLSVGSMIVMALVRTGGPKNMRIADFDEIAVSNLNRMWGDLLDVGLKKTVAVARHAWEIDPFLEIGAFESGLTADTMEQFLLSEPRLGVFIDEMDNLKMKIAAREICRKNRVPVVMATDNGEGVILDVERFDEEPDRPVFHGILEGMQDSLDEPRSSKEWMRIASMIIGVEYMTNRLKHSLMEIRKTVSGIAQIGTGTIMAGAAVATAVKRIASNERLPSGKYVFGLENIEAFNVRGMPKKPQDELTREFLGFLGIAEVDRG